MALTTTPETDLPLGALAQAVGPDYAWLRVGETQSRCLVRAGELALAPIVLPIGLRSLVDAFTKVIPIPEAKAAELLYHGALSADPAIREAVRPGLQPLADRVREILDSVSTHGRQIRAVVLDIPGGSIPGLPQALQELWPDQRVVALESLGLTSIPEMPATGFSPRPDASATAAGMAAAAAAGAVSFGPSVPTPGTEGAPVGSPEVGPVVDPAAPLQEHPSAGNALLAWLAFLAAVVLFAVCIILWNKVEGVSDRVDYLSTQVQTLRKDWLQQHPGSSAPTISQLLGSGVSTKDNPLPVSAARVATRVPASFFGLGGGVLGARAIPETSRAGETSELPGVRSRAIEDGSVHGIYGGPDVLPSQVFTDPSPASLSVAKPSVDAMIVLAAASGAAPPVVGPAAPTEPGGASVGNLPEPPVFTEPAMSPLAATMTLPEVFKQAGDRSLGAKEAEYRLQSTEAQGTLARTPYNPELSIQGTYSTVTNVNDTRPGFGVSSAGIYLTDNLDLFGSTGALKRAERGANKSARIAVDIAREQALFEAAAAYLDAREAQQEVAARQEVLAVARRQLETSKARLAAGFVSRNDVVQASSRISTAENDLATAMQGVEQAELRLGAAVHVAPGNRVEPDPGDAWLPSRITMLSAQSAETLAENHYSVIQADAAVQNRAALVDVAEHMRAPSVNPYVGGQIVGGAGSNGQFGPVAGVNVLLPLYDGGAAGASVRKAKANLNEAKTLRQDTLERTASQIGQAQAALKYTQQHDVDAAAAVSSAREAVNGAQRRYEAGYASLSDVQQAETQLDDALRAISRARLEGFRSQLDFLRATGRLMTLQIGTANGSRG